MSDKHELISIKIARDGFTRYKKGSHGWEYDLASYLREQFPEPVSKNWISDQIEKYGYLSHKGKDTEKAAEPVKIEHKDFDDWWDATVKGGQWTGLERIAALDAWNYQKNLNKPVKIEGVRKLQGKLAALHMDMATAILSGWI